jgi:hypothetical protein
LNKIFIDFGPYPLSKNWELKETKEVDDDALDQTERKRQRQRRAFRARNDSKLFLPPDEDNYDKHGIKNLVI